MSMLENNQEAFYTILSKLSQLFWIFNNQVNEVIPITQGATLGWKTLFSEWG